MLKPGTNNYFKIALVSESSRDIISKKSRRVRYLEYFKPIVPLKVKIEEQQLQQIKNILALIPSLKNET